MTETTTKRCTGQLSYVEDVVREARAEVDEDGNVVIVDGFDNLDVGDSSLYCSECGLVTWPEYEAHGLSDFWEVV
jgi:hypothetical protein